MMWMETLRSSSLYGGLMKAVAEIGIAVGPCARIMSSMVSLVGSDWYAVSQPSVYVGEFLVR